MHETKAGKKMAKNGKIDYIVGKWPNDDQVDNQGTLVALKRKTKLKKALKQRLDSIEMAIYNAHSW